MSRLEGKIAMVAGGGRGLGYGTARRLAREGATIAIAEIDEETGPIARAEIEKDFGVPFVFVRRITEKESRPKPWSGTGESRVGEGGVSTGRIRGGAES